MKGIVRIWRLCVVTTKVQWFGVSTLWAAIPALSWPAHSHDRDSFWAKKIFHMEHCKVLSFGHLLCSYKTTHTCLSESVYRSVNLTVSATQVLLVIGQFQRRLIHKSQPHRCKTLSWNNCLVLAISTPFHWLWSATQERIPIVSGKHKFTKRLVRKVSSYAE